MSNDQKISAHVKAMHQAWELNNRDLARFHNEQLTKLIMQRTPDEIKQMETDKGLI